MQWGGVLKISFAVGLFSSAFVVFEAWCQNIDPMVGLTWFSLFAFLASTFRHGADLLSGVGSSRGTLGKVVGCALLYAMYFVVILLALGRTSAVYVLTMLLLQPVAMSSAAIVYLGDKVHSKTLYFGGLILTLVGLVLFRLDAWRGAGASVTTWDVAMVIVVALIAAGSVIRTKLTREGITTVPFVFQVSFALTTLLGLVVALFMGKAQELTSIPFRSEVLPLLYLGIVPTAIANVLLQEYTNRYGMPFVQCLEATKPIWGVLISWILGIFVSIKQPNLDFLKTFGITIAMLGVCIAVGWGRPYRIRLH